MHFTLAQQVEQMQRMADPHKSAIAQSDAEFEAMLAKQIERWCSSWPEPEKAALRSDVMSDLVWTPLQDDFQAMNFYFLLLEAKACVIKSNNAFARKLSDTKFATALLGLYSAAIITDSDYKEHVIVMDELLDKFTGPLCRMIVPAFFDSNGAFRTKYGKILGTFFSYPNISNVMARFIVSSLTSYQIGGTWFFTSELHHETWKNVCHRVALYVMLHEVGHVVFDHHKVFRDSDEMPKEWNEEKIEIRKYMEARSLNYDEEIVKRTIHWQSLELISDKFAASTMIRTFGHAPDALFAIAIYHHARAFIQMIMGSIHHQARVQIPRKYEYYFRDAIANGESHPRPQVRAVAVRDAIEDQFGSACLRDYVTIDECLFELFMRVYDVISNEIIDWNCSTVHRNWRPSLGDYFRSA